MFWVYFVLVISGHKKVTPALTPGENIPRCRLQHTVCASQSAEVACNRGVRSPTHLCGPNHREYTYFKPYFICQSRPSGCSWCTWWLRGWQSRPSGCSWCTWWPRGWQSRPSGCSWWCRWRGTWTCSPRSGSRSPSLRIRDFRLMKTICNPH